MRYNAPMPSTQIGRTWKNTFVRLRQLRSNLAVRLIAASVSIILLSLLATHGAALLILQDEMERDMESSLRQGERAAWLVLAERASALDALMAVLSQHPTLQRLLAKPDLTALAHFAEDFRMQNAIDWMIVCHQDALLLVHPGAPQDDGLCNPSTPVGYRWVGTAPVLIAHLCVGAQRRFKIVAGQALDADFLGALTAASGLEHGVVDPMTQRHPVSTWATERSISDITADGKDPLRSIRQAASTAGDTSAVAFTALHQDDPAQLWLESALPISARRSAEQRVVALLALSTTISAVILIGVAVLGARRINRSVLDALQRSKETVTSMQSERMAALEALDALIQSIVEGVIMADDAGVVRFISAGATRILETSPEDATGALLDTLILPADDAPLPMTEWLAQLGHNRMLEVRTQSGKSLTVTVSATRIHPSSKMGRLNAFILRDVTEEEAHHRLRSYFLSSISHEFRTPLSTLKASLELLVGEENPLDPAESRQLLRPAYRSVVGLQTLIDNLLTSSTIEAGQFMLHLDDVDLNTILADAIRVVTPLLDRQKQELILDLPAISPPVIGDAAQLTQVLINLLSNASKYSPSGAPIEVTIARCTGDPGQAVRVAVADHGSGVDPTQRAEIFRRFVRHHENEREQYGVGLGLYVAKSTILAHKGRIDVDERPGGGSVFWFELPTT